ncbi:MAG: response regulator transcription factor [Winogradskyella sp.]|uniref:LytR/AlgR family response regulator transcription factor n=1 Tax=Winogradskyella sp. TaxID=1883156 RepID=UPI0025DD2D8D|nr:LytTR family DNA-binding domain-containing protein [Winogradskyella sp.]NRB59436.1 response regulator transcription factor [Winogradskyella sp.]
MKTKCLIVDDEPIAQQILEQHIEKVETLTLIGKCSNAIEAMNVLHQNEVDLMFLDIKMPSMTGLELLKSLQKPPKVILTTAFSEFGVESYEYGVTDYLLKPISLERFLKAVNKVLMLKGENEQLQKEATQENDFIFFKADKKIHKYFFKDILFIEGSGNYVKILSKGKRPLLVLDKLSELLDKLPTKQFCRVHKSYIVNMQKITQVQGNRILFKDNIVPISATYKQDFENHLMNP